MEYSFSIEMFLSHWNSFLPWYALLPLYPHLPGFVHNSVKYYKKIKNSTPPGRNLPLSDYFRHKTLAMGALSYFFASSTTRYPPASLEKDITLSSPMAVISRTSPS